MPAFPRIFATPRRAAARRVAVLLTSRRLVSFRGCALLAAATLTACRATERNASLAGIWTLARVDGRPLPGAYVPPTTLVAGGLVLRPGTSGDAGAYRFILDAAEPGRAQPIRLRDQGRWRRRGQALAFRSELIGAAAIQFFPAIDGARLEDGVLVVRVRGRALSFVRDSAARDGVEREFRAPIRP